MSLPTFTHCRPWLLLLKLRMLLLLLYALYGCWDARQVCNCWHHECASTNTAAAWCAVLHGALL
jgi:hypothetical protein